ncbi:MAG: YihY/virulence factor BrkB family protein [Bacteroidales bacterium]|nr:YihY/virulence factor BrkB family protein [Bacteroidales bacterium]
MNVVSAWFSNAANAVKGFFVHAATDVKTWAQRARIDLSQFARRTVYRRQVRSVLYWLHHISLPGNRGVPLYDVLRYFLVSLFNGHIYQRAKALAFSFLLALPPLLIFLFSLIAFFPLDGIQDELMAELSQVIPEKIFTSISTTIDDIMGHKHTTLLSIGFVSSIILAANGMNGIIVSLNFANNSVEKRPYVERYLLCIALVFVLFVVIALALALIIGHRYVLHLLIEQGIFFDTAISTLLFNVLRWLLLSFTTLVAVSLIYYLAPVKKQRVGFFSSGAILATGMFFLLVWGMGVYLNNFNRYNLLYGSIGTLLMLMLWTLFTCIVLLVGYELNISIYNGTLHKKNAENRKQIRQKLKNISK